MVIDVDTELKSLNGRLQKIVDGFNEMKQAGLSPDIMIAYMCYNLHMSKANVQKILDCQEEFYDKLVKKITIRKLKE